MNYKTLNSKIVKTALLKTLLVILFMVAGKTMFAQSYDVYISNRALTAANQLEFDVYIKSNGTTGSWAVRTYQCGYKFAQAFVNGGTLSGAYISGSSDMASTFGKTWAFSYNSANRVLQQSANTGGTCPGGAVSATASKIGRFRVTNTVNFGCVNDSMTIMRSGTGFTLFALSKWNDPTCIDGTNAVITANGTTYASGAGSALAVTASAPATLNCGNNVDVTVSASGGFGAYTGTGSFSRGSGSWDFTVSDSRGCQASASVSIAVGGLPSSSNSSASACDSYSWNGNTYTQSGNYSKILVNAAGCDSTANLALTITASTSNTTTQSVCDSYTWTNTGLSYTQSGVYTGSTSGCVTQLLNLTITTSSFNTTSQSACDSYTWTNTGLSYTQSGVDRKSTRLNSSQRT